MTVHHSAADSLLWLCITAGRGSRTWVSPVAAWCPEHPACTWDSPGTPHASSPGAGIWIGTAKLIPKAVLALLSKLDSLACKWEPAGSECMHRSDGGYKVGNPLNSLPVFPSSLDAPHWALPGWSGTVVTGCAWPYSPPVMHGRSIHTNNTSAQYKVLFTVSRAEANCQALSPEINPWKAWSAPGYHLFLVTARAPQDFPSLLPSAAASPCLRKQLHKDALHRRTSKSQEGHMQRKNHCRPNSLCRSKFSALAQMSNCLLCTVSGFVRKEVTHSWGSCCNLGGLPGEGETHSAWSVVSSLLLWGGRCNPPQEDQKVPSGLNQSFGSWQPRVSTPELQIMSLGLGSQPHMGWLRRCLAHGVLPQWNSRGQRNLCFHGVPLVCHHNGWKTFPHLLLPPVRSSA